jgi:hypothetical protein
LLIGGNSVIRGQHSVDGTFAKIRAFCSGDPVYKGHAVEFAGVSIGPRLGTGPPWRVRKTRSAEAREERSSREYRWHKDARYVLCDLLGKLTASVTRRFSFSELSDNSDGQDCLMYDTISFLLKTLGAAISAAFGMLALMTEFKDDKKHVTRAGQAALYGILGGFLLSTITGVIDYHKERTSQRDAAQKTLEAVARSEVTIQNIDRLLQPLGDIRVSFNFLVQESSRAKKYIAEIKKNSLAAIKNYQEDGDFGDHGITVMPYGDGRYGFDPKRVWVVSIDGNAPTLPSYMGPNDDLYIRNIGFEVMFFSKRTDPKAFSKAKVSWPKPDYRFKVYAASIGRDAKLDMDYYPEDKTIELAAGDLPVTVEEDNGAITSVRDLSDSLMVVHVFVKNDDIVLDDLDLTVAKGKATASKVPGV